jgi:hypothetical protein
MEEKGIISFRKSDKNLLSSKQIAKTLETTITEKTCQTKQRRLGQVFGDGCGCHARLRENLTVSRVG